MAIYSTPAEVSSEIEALVKEHVSMDVDLSPDTLLEDDLSVDSLERVELGVKLEKKFGISLPDDKIRQSATVGDLIQLVLDAQNASNVH
ncbi:acyl carrier protein [Dictyobacter kobayashii]|uniref:Acyl carrier protein n=1 Tax=Dictyobacter kobayashii TaxID=2014872 RepID=A0A402AQ67_9CHLR|nr:acyl carrier protein [Dictyobacter kobayashii]GCE21256.1 acyl carrier protein [Dictyobacter kobayashii]